MFTKTSFLIDAEAPSHIVYPCADETRIAEAVTTFTIAGIQKGDAVVLVTTEPRQKMIEAQLAAEGNAVAELQATGQLAFVDAETLLSVFMADGMPDAGMFKNRVGQMIDRASVNPATGRPRKVRIFGEMVSLLYMNSNTPAATRLEEFWEEMVAAHSIALFCAYSLKMDSDRLPQGLIDCHSHDLSCHIH